MGKIRIVTVEHEGRVIGSLRKPGKSWQFRTKINSKRLYLTLKGVIVLEEALSKAREIWISGGAVAVPTPAPVPTKKTPPTIESVGRLMVRYLRNYEAENRRSSLQRIRPTLLHFLKYLGGWTTPPSIISRKRLIAYRNDRAKSVARATVNSDMQRVKSFVNWVMDEDEDEQVKRIQGNPTRKVKRLTVSGVAEEAISPGVVRATVEAFGETWLADLALLLANVGLRPQEGLHIRSMDVDEKQKLVHIRAWEKGEYHWQIKTHEDRVLALNDVAFAVLTRRKVSAGRGDALLFPSPTGKPWDYDNFAKVWRKALPASLRGKAYPYAFRHYFATQAVLAGERLEKVSKLLGHKSVATTEKHYADLRALTLGAPPVLATEIKKVATG